MYPVKIPTKSVVLSILIVNESLQTKGPYVVDKDYLEVSLKNLDHCYDGKLQTYSSQLFTAKP